MHRFPKLAGLIAGGALLVASGTANADTIVGIAAGDDRFSTLVELVQAAGLVDTLNGDGPFTVFAPTNDAFAALPAETVTALTAPENRDQLIAVLTYHVVPGALTAEDVLAAGTADTVQGEAVDFSVQDGVAMVDNATIVATDIEAENGIIHVIDAVIVPGQ